MDQDRLHRESCLWEWENIYYPLIRRSIEFFIFSQPTRETKMLWINVLGVWVTNHLRNTKLTQREMRHAPGKEELKGVQLSALNEFWEHPDENLRVVAHTSWRGWFYFICVTQTLIDVTLHTWVTCQLLFIWLQVWIVSVCRENHSLVRRNNVRYRKRERRIVLEECCSTDIWILPTGSMRDVLPAGWEGGKERKQYNLFSLDEGIFIDVLNYNSFTSSSSEFRAVLRVLPQASPEISASDLMSRLACFEQSLPLFLLLLLSRCHGDDWGKKRRHWSLSHKVNFISSDDNHTIV